MKNRGGTIFLTRHLIYKIVKFEKLNKRTKQKYVKFGDRFITSQMKTKTS